MEMKPVSLSLVRLQLNNLQQQLLKMELLAFMARSVSFPFSTKIKLLRRQCLPTCKVLGYSDLSQGQYQDLPNFPSYMFNAPDITEEYNVLNEFLYSSLLDDGNMYSGNSAQPPQGDSSFNNTIAASTSKGPLPNAGNPKNEGEKESTEKQPSSDDSNAAKSSTKPEKEDEKLYMKIADPSGNETGQERMNKLLQAKYNAGLLKPFNYVQGYARLNKYMESHLQPLSRQKILKQLDKFRPKFRERMQSLTDMQLMLVEMWFERTLMEYDRVFASMAIPSCCWRRTGEIFRGNKEMAELIHVPIDQLRDVSRPPSFAHRTKY